MTQAILFDLDGVLVDSCEWHKNGLNLALEFYGYKAISEEDHITTFNGLPTKTKLSLLNVPSSSALLIEAKKQEYTKKLIQDTCQLNKILISTLSQLKRDNLAVGCVTNCIKETASLMLEKIGILELMDIVVTNEYGGLPKPSPEPYLYAAKKLNLDPSSILVLEDSPKGILSAKQANCRVFEIHKFEDVCYERIHENIQRNY